MNSRASLSALAALVLLASACSERGDGVPRGDDARLAQDAAAEPPDVPVHVDSIFPIEEHLRRFREGLGPEPARLSGGAPSRDALVARLAEALAARDTAAFADMVLTRAEFAWLYYPHTRYTVPPYRLAPEILWFQIQNSSSRGFGRLLDRMGGTRLDAGGYRCPTEPVVEGPNRVWEACVIAVDGSAAASEGPSSDMRLFGSILERDGVFKFVSYTNDF